MQINETPSLLGKSPANDGKVSDCAILRSCCEEDMDEVDSLPPPPEPEGSSGVTNSSAQLFTCPPPSEPKFRETTMIPLW